MQEYELENLLQDIGLQKIKRKNGRKGTNWMFNCPFHGESHPSAGVILDGNSVYGGCFACKEKFTLPKLVAQCLDISIWDAVQYINEKYNIERRKINKSKRFREYGEVEELEERFELPIHRIAPFKSGKVIHKYFMRRGFVESTAQKFLIGWDITNKRITVPVFYQDGILAGIIGRAVLNQDDDRYEDVYGEEPKYFIYDKFPIGNVLFGEHLFEGTDTAILVEGSFDIMWMHQCGFTNTLSTIIANLTEKQREVLFKLGIQNVVLFYDNDKAGVKACKVAYEMLKPFFRVYGVTYPENAKDPLDLSKEQIQEMLDNKHFYWKNNFAKIK